jgi:glycosyltransferase involved in cell wall biosynthesis
MFAGSEMRMAEAPLLDGAVLPTGVRRELERAIEALRPDVVVSHIAMNPAVARAAARFAPVVVHAHDYFTACPGGARYEERSQVFCEEGPGARCFWRAYMERTTNRRPDRLVRAYSRVRAWRDSSSFVNRFFVASPFVRDVLAAWHGGIITVVGYPVERWAGAPVEPSIRPDVVYVGRLARSKGVSVLVRAAAMLDGTSMVIAGDGPERGELEREVHKLGLADRVRFVGTVDPAQREGLFQAAQVFAMPSLWDEPFGIVGVEALAAGLPVVASRVGGIPMWLDGGGVLVERGSVVDLAGGLDAVLRDDDRRARLAAQGPEVARRFSADAHLDQVIPELRAAVASPLSAARP